MHLLSVSPMNTDHAALVMSAISMIGMLIFGILGIALGRSKKASDAEMVRQSVECRFEHQTLAEIVGRIEEQGKIMLDTQRSIVTMLERVAEVLEKVSDKLNHTRH